MISIPGVVHGMRAVTSLGEIQQTECALYCPQKQLIRVVRGAQMPAKRSFNIKDLFYI